MAHSTTWKRKNLIKVAKLVESVAMVTDVSRVQPVYYNWKSWHSGQLRQGCQSISLYQLQPIMYLIDPERPPILCIEPAVCNGGQEL